MSYFDSNVYFAADTDAERTVEYLTQKSQEWFRNVEYNRYLDKIKHSWSSYHGIYYEDSHNISFGGEQGELVNLAVNHYRNIAKHILNMVTASRPSFQARAINTDRKSLVQAQLANGLLDYYMRERRLERYIKKAVEYAIVLGSGFVKMEWNSTKGEITDFIEPDPSSIVEYDEDGEPLDEDGNILKATPVYQGDVEFYTLSPFDVVFDPTKETPEQQKWAICRTFINKYDLAAKYPEYTEEILSIAPKGSNGEGRVVSITPYDDTTDIPVYEFFHEPTEAVPEGRYLLYLDHSTVLMDTPLPYPQIPLYRIAPSDILGTPYGYTEMWDLLPIQDTINSLYSTIATNQNAFGVQNILNPMGNGLKVNQMEGGLNFLEYTPMPQIPGGGKPEPLNLTNTPAEIFNFIPTLIKDMETISGVNSVARGNPEASLKSGNALALVQSQALQFMSGLQQSYIQMLEDVGTGLIGILKQFADAPRVVAIAGLNNATKVEEFKAEDLSEVSRVVVDVGNALMQTTAGRAQVAENLLQMMPDKMSPEKYLMVLNTGNLDTLTDGIMDELQTIIGENEALVKGDVIIALATDHHSMHIREHRDVLSDQKLRQDVELVDRTLAHIQEHILLLQNTDPNLLAIIGEQPLAPAGGTPIGQQPPGQAPIPGTGAPLQDMSQLNPEQPLPSMPEAAGVAEGILPPQPQTPEDLL